MVKAKRALIDAVIWPEYQQLADLLRAHLDEVANTIIDQTLGTERPAIAEA
jgi:hypothetical protein